MADVVGQTKNSANPEGDVNHPATPKDSTTDSDEVTSDSAYMLSSDHSMFSQELDCWLKSGSPTESTGIQISRTPLVQRGAGSALATSLSFGSSVWYILAMMLPFFSQNYSQWRCSPSALLHSVEVMASHAAQAYTRLRAQLRRFADNEIARELFATAMDIVLVVYAVGFLILSLHQAAVIG